MLKIEDYNPVWSEVPDISKEFGHPVYSFIFDCPQCKTHKICLLMHDGPHQQDVIWKYTQREPREWSEFSLHPSIKNNTFGGEPCGLHITINNGIFFL